MREIGGVALGSASCLDVRYVGMIFPVTSSALSPFFFSPSMFVRSNQINYKFCIQKIIKWTLFVD